MPEYAWIRPNKQDSEFAVGPKYAKILNIAGFSIYKNMQELHRVLNMAQITENVCIGREYVLIWIYNNRQGSEYVSYQT